MPNPLSTIGATILQLISTAAGLAVGLGVLGEPVEQAVVAVAGIVIGAIIQIVGAVDRHNAALILAAKVRK